MRDSKKGSKVEKSNERPQTANVQVNDVTQNDVQPHQGVPTSLSKERT